VFLSKRRRERLVCLAGAIAAALSLHSLDAASADQAASAAIAASDSVTSLINADSLPPHFAGDDPEHVRDALSTHVTPAKSNVPPSITSRVRSFLQHPLKPFHKTNQLANQAASQPSTQAELNRTFLFVIPASYGVRYEARRKLLTVNVSLASPDNPGVILLKQSVTGQSGRKLVIAPEAKAKGYIQTFDTIQFQSVSGAPTNVQGTTLAPGLKQTSNDDFAIVLVCTLEPPYMTEVAEHSDPTDEEPTDITRKTSTLQGIVDAVWLINRNDGSIVTKRLRLTK
jgi:hypothetical protein